MDSETLLRKNRRIKRLVRTRFLWMLAAIMGWCLTLSCAIANRAHAQNCDDRARIVNHLQQHYGEHTIAVAVLESGRLVQIMVGETGTFSVLIVQADGVACLVLSGDGWQATAPGNPS